MYALQGVPLLETDELLQVDHGNASVLETVDDVHVLTGALKLFFRELKELLSDLLRILFCSMKLAFTLCFALFVFICLFSKNPLKPAILVFLRSLISYILSKKVF